MRFNFAEALAEQREQDRRAQVAALFDLRAERWLLAAIIADDAIENRPPFVEHRVSPIALVDDNLETDDFSDFHHRAVFRAWRNVQARNVRDAGQAALALELQTARLKPIALYDVFEELERGLSVHDVRPVEGEWFLGWLFDLVTTTPRVWTEWVLFATARLRSLAEIRRLV